MNKRLLSNNWLSNDRLTCSVKRNLPLKVKPKRWRTLHCREHVCSKSGSSRNHARHYLHFSGLVWRISKIPLFVWSKSVVASRCTRPLQRRTVVCNWRHPAGGQSRSLVRYVVWRHQYARTDDKLIINEGRFRRVARTELARFCLFSIYRTKRRSGVGVNWRLWHRNNGDMVHLDMVNCISANRIG